MSGHYGFLTCLTYKKCIYKHKIYWKFGSQSVRKEHPWTLKHTSKGYILVSLTFLQKNIFSVNVKLYFFHGINGPNGIYIYIYIYIYRIYLHSMKFLFITTIILIQTILLLRFDNLLQPFLFSIYRLIFVNHQTDSNMLEICQICWLDLNNVVNFMLATYIFLPF